MPRLCQMSLQLKNHLAFSHPQKEGNLSSGVNGGSIVFIYFYRRNLVLVINIIIMSSCFLDGKPGSPLPHDEKHGTCVFFSTPSVFCLSMWLQENDISITSSFLMAVSQECRTHQWCASEASSHQHLLLTTRVVIVVVQVGYLQSSCTFSQHEGWNRSI